MATPAMETALAARFANLFGAIRIDLPAATIRLLDGAGALTFDGGTYLGRDPTFGTLAAIESIGDGVGDEAPTLSFTMLPASTASAADLASPTAQGSRVRVMLGAFVPETGGVVADPIVLFDGELDQATLTIGKGARELDFDCVSSFERFFFNQEGVRLSPAFHKSLFPGETGLDNVTGVTRPVYWGVATPASALAGTGSGTAFYGGRNPFAAALV